MIGHCCEKRSCASSVINFLCDVEQVTKSPLVRREHFFFLRLLCIRPNGKNQYGLLRRMWKSNQGSMSKTVINARRAWSEYWELRCGAWQVRVSRRQKRMIRSNLNPIFIIGKHTCLCFHGLSMSMIPWTGMDKNSISTSAKKYLQCSPSLRNVLWERKEKCFWSHKQEIV